MEFDGPWSWADISPTKLLEVHRLLAEMEKLTWDEAMAGWRGRISIYRLSDCPNPDVLDRLVVIRRDDIEQIVQIHMSGQERIWGVRRGNACHLLWWDPDHEVWPSKLKNT